MKRVLAAVVLAVTLAACGQNAASLSIEKELLEKLESGSETVSIPTGGLESTWSRASIVCPYDTAEGASADVQKVFAERGNLFAADDASQWIVLSKGRDISVHEVSRDRIDFCANDSNARVVTPADEFRVTGGSGESGDPWILAR